LLPGGPSGKRGFSEVSQAGLTLANIGLQIFELMLSAKPNEATVNNAGTQNRFPNCFTNKPKKTKYSGKNAHLLLKNIIMGSNPGIAHRWLINTNKSLSKTSSTNNIKRSYPF
jgi:hypothetical protein